MHKALSIQARRHRKSKNERRYSKYGVSGSKQEPKKQAKQESSSKTSKARGIFKAKSRKEKKSVGFKDVEGLDSIVQHPLVTGEGV